MAEQRDKMWISQIAKERPKLVPRPFCYKDYEHGNGEPVKIDLENDGKRGGG